MGIWEVLLLGIGLSMDAFAVSVCKGLALKEISLGRAAVCGIWFGGFQGLMPVIGYLLGVRLTTYVSMFTPWIAFILLSLIGGSMIREVFQKGEEEEFDDDMSVRTMLLLAVATSIDALAVGVTFACVPVKIFGGSREMANTLFGAGVIAVTTFLLSMVGVKVGNLVGTRFGKRAELSGGIILILLGLKLLLEGIL